MGRRSQTNRKPSSHSGVGAERSRLQDAKSRKAHWYRWGPYLSERQWGTVREDYSPGGTAWDYFPHDHARSRTYRWGEDGLAGLSDRHCRVCFAWSFWNYRDPILKERLFGLTNVEGNHGEDVKEYYYYLDSTPTHSYMKFLYRYPQLEFPYEALVRENRKRGPLDPEFELIDTGVFGEDRYFDIEIEYAKSGPEDILIRATIHNRGPETAPLAILPTIWFRNTWAWGEGAAPKPSLTLREDGGIEVDHPHYGKRILGCSGSPEILFTENETNAERLFGAPNRTGFVKDAFHEYLVRGDREAVNPGNHGTKAAALYRIEVRPGESAVITLRLTDSEADAEPAGTAFEEILANRIEEAAAFFGALAAEIESPEMRLIQRQAFAGLAWSKQWFHYDVKSWLNGDPAGPPPPPDRKTARNSGWKHLHTSEVLLMPDKWEFPWFAVWDSAFQCVAYAAADPDFSKEQLLRFLREWYMHPNGQLPAYEWALSDVNPPVHAWACWRVFEIDAQLSGTADIAFLEEAFHKLLLNFTWWVNRKDPEGRNVFEGGFLGLDNIGLFDRSHPPPMGGQLEQSDGTSWMAMYCLNMLAIAKRLALGNPAYEGIANKFLEHFVQIAHAIHDLGGKGVEIWDEEDGFYYDVLHWPGIHGFRMKVRSMVGLVPLFATGIVEAGELPKLPAFARRKDWYLENNEDARRHIESAGSGEETRLLFSIVTRERLARVLRIMLDEREFLSPFGVRSLSKVHLERPYVLNCGGEEFSVGYEPGESTSGLFGGNSNWRGPVWFPMNFLIVESLRIFYRFHGDGFKVECPTGSGDWKTLNEVADNLAARLVSVFARGEDGRRPSDGATERARTDPHWKDCILFNEYFHGDTGAGLGANHQTGWTALAALLMQPAPGRTRN
jgi:hypothetical protein